MGGSLILLALVLSTVLWADLANGYVWATLFLTVGFGAVGAADDYLKVSRRNPKGLPGKLKLLAEIVIGLAVAAWVMRLTRSPLDTSLAVPFLKNLLIDFGWIFLGVSTVVLVGSDRKSTRLNSSHRL